MVTKVILLKFNIILIKISENCYYTKTIHFHAHVQCLKTSGPLLLSVFLLLPKGSTEDTGHHEARKSVIIA